MIMSETSYTFENFVRDHEGQLLASAVPAIYWDALYEKLAAETYDAGTYFQMVRVIHDEDSESFSWKIAVTDQRMSATEATNIFLVDHAWSFSVEEMNSILNEHPHLLDRMCGLMDITDAETREAKMAEVKSRLWKFANSYQVRVPSESDPEALCPTTVWYIMDEFGSRIQHSDDPSAACIPLFYLPRGICYTVLWLKKSLASGEELTRDYISHVRDSSVRPYRLLPWKHADFSSESSAHVTLEEDFFLSHRVAETFPVEDAKPVTLPSNRPLRVYAEIAYIREFLKDERYVLTDIEEEADILWYFSHFKDFEKLSREKPNALLNQFPCEFVLTAKDLLAALASETDGGGVSWHPEAYNLVKELPQFVAEYQKREKAGDPNYWILKPWNLGRSIGIIITDSLTRIMRCVDTGPLIASRYVHQPVLFYRDDLDIHVKFDVRYMLLIRSVKPLRCYVYNVFWLRFANKTFDLSDFEDYDKHFTVMNYRTGNKLKQIHCEDFVPLFDKQYPDNKWATVEASIHELLRQTALAVTKNPPPKGFAPCHQSRAMYGVDIILEWRDVQEGNRTIRPLICEANFQADCTRACKYHPHFFNDIFNTLFLDEPTNVTPLF